MQNKDEHEPSLIIVFLVFPVFLQEILGLYQEFGNLQGLEDWYWPLWVLCFLWTQHSQT